MINLHCVCNTELLSFVPLSDTTCEVGGFACDSTHPRSLMIPSCAPDGRAVVSIGVRAFEGCRELYSVILPDSVREIGRRAFAFCTSLREIRVGAESDLSFIGNRAFMGCEALTVLRLSHLSTDLVCDDRAFAHCTHLRLVTLPSRMSAIGNGMFEGCRALIHVSLPSALRRVGTAAFSTCTSLRWLALPQTVEMIEDVAFAWCDHLTPLTLPTRECVIAASAFMNCPAVPDFMKAS